MKTETIRIRLNSDLMETIREQAQQQVRPIAKQIEYLLLKAIKEEK